MTEPTTGKLKYHYNKILSMYEGNCPYCKTALRHTGRQKLLAPPLDVLQCDECLIEFIRSTKDV